MLFGCIFEVYDIDTMAGLGIRDHGTGSDSGLCSKLATGWAELQLQIGAVLTIMWSRG